MAGERVLVVEDHPVSRELAVELLTAAGYIVLEAGDANGLLERVKQERPDLIVLDLQLPGVDGLTFLGQLTGDPATRQIPVLAVSAYAQPEVQTQALELGCAHFLAKPYETRALLFAVARLLGQ